MGGNSMTTYVLVHGAWHGGWSWKRVAQIFRKNGDEVFTPTLTGLGERSHLISADIGLDTHIQDIAAVLDYEDLQDVILVAHSYGAMVISGVAETHASRIKQLVYIDAFVPIDGQWMAQFFPAPAVEVYKEKSRLEGKGYGIPSPPPEVLGITSQADLAWVRPRLGLQPRKSFYDPIHLSNPRAA
jgi:pimeloyl-ACP methyl ester carboxylesterase